MELTTETTEDTTDENVGTTEVAETTDENADTADALAKVRREAHNLRERTKAAEARADQLARALFTARVAATGKVSNPAEIAYDADLLDDADALNAAVDAAIAERPYIKSRKVSGDAGQGQHGQTAPLDFSGLFK
jgi:hypothetical protein